MRADAALVVEHEDGRTRCTTVRSSPPFTIRQTRTGPGSGPSPRHHDHDPGVTVHLVGGTAGPLGGDRLGLSVLAGPRSTLTVRSVAATLALPGPSPGSVSHLDVRAAAGPGACLRWQPEPTILVRGSDLRSATSLSLAQGATVVWREVIVLGRAGEPSGSALHRLRVDVADRPLLRTDLAVGPRWPASQGPAGVGEAGAIGTAVVVGPAVSGLEPVAHPGVRAGRADLDRDAVLITVLGRDPRAVLTAIDAQIAPAERAPGG